MEEHQRLRRRLGFPAVFSICTGAMFSSGFFLLPGLAAGETGPAVPLVYVLAGLAVLPATLCVAELASGIPRAGGPYLFLLRAMGPAAATIGGLGKWVQLLFKSAFSFVGVGYYLTLVVDLPIVPVAVGLVILFTALNLLGAKQTAAVEMGLVAVLLVLLVYFVVAGGAELAAAPPDPGRFSPLLPSGGAGLLAGMALVTVSFAGIGQVASLAEEVSDPARTLPRGMLAALGVATLLYAAGTALMVALISPEALRDDVRPAATAAAQLDVLPLPVWLIVVAALAAFMSTGNAGILSAARFPLAMARDGFVWRRFAALDGKGTPRVAVIVTGAATAVLIVLLDVEGIAKLASAFLLLVFGALCLAVLVLREGEVADYDPGFRVPLYPAVPLAGVVLSLVLIVASGWQAWLFIGGFIGAGTWWYVVHVRERASSRIGASAHLVAKAAHVLLPSATVRLEPPGVELTAADDLAERAVVVDLDPGATLDDAVGQAAQILGERVGADRDELARRLRDQLRVGGGTPGPAALASVLVEGIRQPEMVAVRAPDGVDLPGGGSAQALLLLVGDPAAASRLRGMERQLAAVTVRPGFPAAWREAETPRQVRAVLRRHPRALAFRVEAGTPTAALADAPLHALALPEGCLVTLVVRDGDVLVPDGRTELLVGDQVTMIGQLDALEAVAERYGLVTRPAP